MYVILIAVNSPPGLMCVAIWALWKVLPLRLTPRQQEKLQNGNTSIGAHIATHINPPGQIASSENDIGG